MEPVGSVRRSSFVTFAGVLAVVVGFFNGIAGIAAISKDDSLEASAHEVLFGIDYTTWGWFWLVLGIAGMMKIFDSIWAFRAKGQLATLPNATLGSTVKNYGWFWLILGIVQIGVGGLILARHPSGLLLGVVWASLSLILTVFVIFVYPFWAFAVIGINILIIWGLLDNADEFTG